MDLFAVAGFPQLPVLWLLVLELPLLPILRRSCCFHLLLRLLSLEG